MQIEWKNIEDKQIKIINSWLNDKDKVNLCMTKNNWEQTALAIEDCLKIMDNSEFKNIMGYIDDKPVVAVMFGIEHIEALNLYNIVISPACRHMGIAKKVVLQLLKNNKSLNLTKPYKKVVASILPENIDAKHLFESLNFDNLGFDDQYVVFEKNIIKTNERVM